jgi:hypothetical protein
MGGPRLLLGYRGRRSPSTVSMGTLAPTTKASQLPFT